MAASLEEVCFSGKLQIEETDGRVDSSLEDDINFGPNHPSTITKEEIDIIGNWIDGGAYISK